MVPQIPSGTVTFLFTDVEGSTRLLKQLRGGYGEVLATHRRLLRASVAEHGGQEIDTQGEAFFFAFARARDAVAAAAAGQRALDAEEWPEGVVVRVRMGIHTGEPVVGDEGYTGMGVHRAARICGAGHGGQVLISNATRELVEDELTVDITLHDLGEHRLKDLDRPEHIYQLDIDGLAHAFPPLKTLAAQSAATIQVAGREERLGEAAQAAVSAGRRVPVRILVTAGVFVATAVAVGVLLVERDRPGSLTGVQENAVGVVDAKIGEIDRQIPVGKSPGSVAVDANAVWVTNTDDGSVSRIDPDKNSVRQTIKVGSSPSGIAVGGDAIWAVNTLDGTVSRIDPETNEVVQTVSVGNHPTGIAVGTGAVWVANTNDSTISRIDAASGDVTETFAAGSAVGPIAVGFGSIWAADRTSGRLIRIDPRTGQIVRSVNVGNSPSGVATGAGATWVANGGDGTVSRIDPRTNVVTSTVTVGTGGANAVVADGETVWASDETEGALARLDPASGGVLDRVEIGNRPQSLTTRGGAVYVAVRASAAAHRGGTLRIVTEAFDSMDPALSYVPLSWAAVTTTNDGLTTFRRVGGGRGSELVPALATTVPTSTNEGRTYTFHLREGVRYSTGRTLQASDFRYAFERAFRAPSSPIVGFLSTLVGASACSTRACDLSRGVVADNRAGTVTFHLARRDPELPYKLALPFTFPVPPGTAPPSPRRIVPATGPYRVASFDGERLRLVRNPRFREWSAATRPDGIPDAIEVRVMPDAERRATAVLSGSADLFWGHDRPPERLPDLRVRFASHLHTNPYNSTFFLVLNNRRGPFSNRDVRRALNYAIDRDELVRLFGGPERVRTTCQVLPPGLPGYAPYCPYTSDPSPDGRWTAPDLTTARRLVDRSGTRDARVTLLYSSALPGPGVAPYTASVLRGLGYRVRLREIPDFSEYFRTIEDPQRMGDAAINGWVADYATPYAFINPQFTCKARLAPNYAGFCDPRIDRRMERALEFQTSDPEEAASLWARVDRDLTDHAPWLFMVNPRVLDIVSERVGGYQYNPQWGVLIDQLWVR